MTYQEMAEKLGFKYCRGITPTGHYCRRGEHRFGFITNDDAGLHLSERRRTRADDYTFLKLVARAAAPPGTDDDVPWRRVYYIGRLAREFGAQLGIRVPGRLWNADKAFVLAGTAGLSNKEPLRKQAYDWARRPRRSTT